MLVDKSTNIFWNMIKNKKDQKMDPDLSASLSKKRGSMFIEQQTGEKENPMKLIEKLPTYTKISILQGLLKEMTSIKERFEDNKKDMLDKIKKNCYDYYKSKIDMKEIFDYCLSNYIENHYNYVLVENTQEQLKDKYEVINEIIMLLRNNNDMMLNIIKICPENFYVQLSDFLVNFFYENTIDSSFNDEELMIMIYLIIEEYILNKMPKEIFNNINGYDYKLFLNGEKNIIHYISKSITRKPDIRNFTCIILSENLLKLEEFNENLTIETKIIEKIINKDKDKNKKTKFKVETIGNKRRGIFVRDSLIKRTLTIGGDSVLNTNKENYNTEISSSINLEGEEIKYRKNSIDIDINDKINLENIKLNSFFYETDVTLEYLNKKLIEFEKISPFSKLI